MASSDVDQKYIGRIAHFTAHRNAVVSEALFQILGLSVVLSRKLYRARKERRLDTTRDTRSLQLYHHIIWLSREGLAILELYVWPYTQNGEQGPECQVLVAKLRASFLHIFCIFHNDPPITAASASASYIPSTGDGLTPTMGSSNNQRYSGSGFENMMSQKENTPPKRNSRGRIPALRDPINSVTSDASFLTNPYAGQPMDSPILEQTAPISPPGIGRPNSLPHPAAFLLPARNFVPIAKTYFETASSTAAALLPGAHPLRLSAAVEHAAFLWDCVHDHEASRQLSRRTIRHLRDGEDDDVADESFEDAAEMVQILGKIMRRKSFDTTPRTARQSSSEVTTGKRLSPPITQAFRPETSRDPPASRVLSPPGESHVTPPRQQSPRQTPPRPPRPDDKDLLETPTRLPGFRSRATSSASATGPLAKSLGAPIQLSTPSSVREARAREPSKSAGIDSGPVGASPLRRGSVKSNYGHRRGPSVQASPQQLQPLPRTPLRNGSVRRKRSLEDATPPRSNAGFSHEPYTPPFPPPKDVGYTPLTKSSSRSKGERRDSTSKTRKVEFAPEQTFSSIKRPQESQRLSGNGVGLQSRSHKSHDSGYFDETVRDHKSRNNP